MSLKYMSRVTLEFLARRIKRNWQRIWSKCMFCCIHNIPRFLGCSVVEVLFVPYAVRGMDKICHNVYDLLDVLDQSSLDKTARKCKIFRRDLCNRRASPSTVVKKTNVAFLRPSASPNGSNSASASCSSSPPAPCLIGCSIMQDGRASC